MKTKLINGECLEEMAKLETGSIDMVLTDPPYGTTACKWDSVIPFEPMWEQLKRITKKNGAIVLTASQPFTSALIMSNVKMFSYCWVWEKSKPVGHLNANRKPMNKHEDVVIFSSRQPTYNPQGLMEIKPKQITRTNKGGIYRKQAGTDSVQKKTGYPRSIIQFQSQNGELHPTQKPVALMEYLIKTYTNEGETVLDFTMGSGTTGLACKNLNRDFIGIEMDEKYFKIASERIERGARQLKFPSLQFEG
jgi:site-specific DNA-methyltransferase (adenine-specific)